jgi:hypothetical protein
MHTPNERAALADDPKVAKSKSSTDVFNQSAVQVNMITARPYRTPQSTVDVFRYLVKLNDPGRPKEWLKARPMDVPTLRKLLEARKHE